MHQRYAFKLLPPRDVVSVLNTIGCQPPPTLDVLEKPTPEAVLGILETVSEFAYELPAHQIKASVPSSVQPREIFQDALDLLVVYTLSRQLAFINGIDDFSLRDLWDPQRKRFHALLSGLINFCRYKESNNTVVSQMKDNVQRMEEARSEAQDQLLALEQRLAEATGQHNQEQPEVRMLEGRAREARALIDKYQKSLQLAEKALEEKNAALAAQKQRTLEVEQRANDARQVAADLQGEVAEGPEGLEQEIQEFNVCIRQLKARLEDKTSEKRSRGQKVQSLSRLEGLVTRYAEELDRAAETAAKSASTQARNANAQDELADLQRSLEATESNRGELEQAVRQVTSDLDKAKADHEELMQDLEVRRERALDQQREVQSKRTEELRRHEALVTQRVELEAEILEVQRAHEVEMAEMRLQYRALQEDAEQYMQELEVAKMRFDGDLCFEAPTSHTWGSPSNHGSGGGKPWRTPGRSPTRMSHCGLRA